MLTEPPDLGHDALIRLGLRRRGPNEFGPPAAGRGGGRIAIMRVRDKVLANTALVALFGATLAPPDPHKCAHTPPHIETPTTLRVQPVSQNFADASSQEPGGASATTLSAASVFWTACAIVVSLIIYFQYFSN